ncbi:hypothetical protein PI125_g13825 [Phytophthora idaei]|nr:hypothetical protein PI125_g13825 [Phytophthora idaei]
MIALLPNQPVQLRLYLGVQPGNKNCPPGMYRPIGAGIAVALPEEAKLPSVNSTSYLSRTAISLPSHSRETQ